MKSSEKPKVSYVVRLQKQGKLGASDASWLSKSLFYFFGPILLIVQSFASQVPGLKAQGFLALFFTM